MAKIIPDVVTPLAKVYTETFWLYTRSPLGVVTTLSGLELDLRAQKAAAEALGSTTTLAKIGKSV